jgi:hypothetical protein
MHPNPAAADSGTPTADTAEISREAVELMAKHGITRSRADIFGYGGYRYTSLSDAVAQATRQPGLR